MKNQNRGFVAASMATLTASVFTAILAWFGLGHINNSGQPPIQSPQYQTSSTAVASFPGAQNPIPDTATSSPSNKNIPISSCQEITSPGNYYLTGNITDPVTSNISHSCLNIHNTNNVYLSCANHTVNSVAPVSVTSVNGFSVNSCNFKAPSGSGQFFLAKIASSTRGEIANNTMDDKISVSDSSYLNVHNNTFSAPWLQTYTTNSVIQNNTFALDIKEYSTVQSLIESDRGSNNQFINNKIDGGSDAVYSTEIGADSGIFFTDENQDIIKSDSIQNTYNCGIETFGLISNTVIDSNTIKNTGYCGIGAWYYNSWLANTVSNNIIDSANRMFDFLRYGGLRPVGFDPGGTYPGHSLPADQYVYFKDNQFINNKSTDNSDLIPSSFDMHLTMLGAKGTSYGETYPQPSQFILQNNVLKNNDFSTTTPLIAQPAMIIDGGGNVCLSTENSEGQLSSTNPIECNSSPSIPINGNSSATINQTSLTISSSQSTVSGTAMNATSLSVNIIAKTGATFTGYTTLYGRNVPVVNGNWSLIIPSGTFASAPGPYTLQVGVVNTDGTVNVLNTGTITLTQTSTNGVPVIFSANESGKETSKNILNGNQPNIVLGQNLTNISAVYLNTVSGDKATYEMDFMNAQGTSLSIANTSYIPDGQYNLYVVNSSGTSLSFSVNVQNSSSPTPITPSPGKTTASIDQSTLKVLPNTGFKLTGETSALSGSLTIAIVGPNYTGTTDWGTISNLLKGQGSYTAVANSAPVQALANAQSYQIWSTSFSGIMSEGYYTVFIYDASGNMLTSGTLWVTSKG